MSTLGTVVLNGETFVLVPLAEFQQMSGIRDHVNGQPSQDEPFGQYLRRILTQLGITEQALAEISKTTQAQISRYLHGQTPQARTKKKMVEAILNYLAPKPR